MTTITIEELASMPGRFRVTRIDNRGKAHHVRDSRCAGDAAAAALRSASGVTGKYCIVGNQRALAQIPEEMRSRR